MVVPILQYIRKCQLLLSVLTFRMLTVKFTLKLPLMSKLMLKNSHFVHVLLLLLLLFLLLVEDE